MKPVARASHRLVSLPSLPRRQFLGRLGLAATCFAVPGAFAEALLVTPRQTEGPFYPDRLPLDTDNDLIDREFTSCRTGRNI